MNMKTGILTYHNIPNFGALLQALALCRALRESGADCEIIDYRCGNLEKRELTFQTSAHPVKTIYRRLFYWPGEKEKIRRCMEFMRAQGIVSAQTYTRATIGEANAVYDTFITGSDMVWNLDINGHDATFFLDFTEEDKQRYSYASSIGGIWDREERKRLLPLLKRYERISVREHDTASWIAKELSLDCEWTADPTMLMEAGEWEKLVSPVRERNYVLVYFPNAGILNAAKTYARRKKKELVVLSSKTFRGRHVKSKALYTPEEWLSCLYGADTVFTDSYHGILFSIYFKKPFWTNNHSNRIESLLAGLNLRGRFIEEENAFEGQIDYDACGARMKDMRREALAYIKHIAEKNRKEKKTHITANGRNCSGCTACGAVCPADAISFEEDSQGFKRPVVSRSKCLECGKCLRACPAQNPLGEREKHHPKAYAVRWEKEEIRKNSASGAFFPAMARYILEEKNGYVCGCVLNSALMPVHIVTDQWTDVLRMQDSKYVQSDLQDCFAAIQTLLSQGRYVLFTGTSCQVAGLKAALDVSGIPDETLLTVDFFCHGVPSPLIWREYLEFYRRKKRREDTGYRFRSKKYGWGKTARGANHLNSVHTGRPAGDVAFRRFRNRGPEEAWDDCSFEARMWRMIFFSDLCLRPYCYACPYATLHKPADITMGDFWGIDVCLPEFDDGKGTSLAIGRTRKGLAALEQIQCLRKREIPVEAAIKRQANAFAPSVEGKERARFWEDYQAHGFDYIAKKYFKYGWAAKVKSAVKLALFKWRLKDYCN